MNKVMKSVSVFACSIAVGGCFNPSASSASSVKYAIVKQLDHASLDEIAASIESKLSELDPNAKIDIYSGQNDQSTLMQIGNQIISDGTSVVIPIGTLAAQTMVVVGEEFDTPVVYAAISDPQAASLVDLPNVTGTSDALNTEKIIEMMLVQNPNMKKVGLLYSGSEANSQKPIAEAKKILKEKGILYIEAIANNNEEVVMAAASLIADSVDAVFTPTDNVIMSAEPAIYEDLANAAIPHYTGADSFVRAGAFATCGINYRELGIKTAELADQIMRTGFQNIKDYYLMDGGIITVNREIAEQLGADPRLFAEFGDVVTVETTGR